MILLQIPTRGEAHFRMRIFNADGSEASMCGNGLRCLAHFIYDIENNPLMFIETAHRLHRCEVKEEGILTELGTVKRLQWNFLYEGAPAYFVHTGVPHFVRFVENIEEIDVEKIGRKIRHAPPFAPHGTNVNFAEIKGDRICIRTYERGVEGETLACGTGAAAVGYVATHILGSQSPKLLHTRSGELLQVTCTGDEISILGPVHKVFSGSSDMKHFD